MSKKSKIIISLLIVAAILFCAIQFWILPAKQAREVEYARNQTDALTHDISVIEDYKNAYVGNASNIIGLFEALPLNDVDKKFEINPDACTLTISYPDTVWNIGEEKVQRDLIYNSVAAMAAIDNLEGITYNFSGVRYSFDRNQLEIIFGSPLSKLLDKEMWSRSVTDKLGDQAFVGQFYDTER